MYYGNFLKAKYFGARFINPASDVRRSHGGAGWVFNIQYLLAELDRLKRAKELAEEAIKPEPKRAKDRAKVKSKTAKPRPNYSEVAAAAQLNVNYDTIQQLAQAIEWRIAEVQEKITLAKKIRKRIEEETAIFLLMY